MAEKIQKEKGTKTIKLDPKEEVAAKKQAEKLENDRRIAYSKYMSDLEKQRKIELRNYSSANELLAAKVENMELTIRQEEILDKYEEAAKKLQMRAEYARRANEEQQTKKDGK